VAKVLRRRIVEIGKLFEAPDARVPDVEKAMQVQVLLVAHDLGLAFAKENPAFDDILVKTVQDEMERGK